MHASPKRHSTRTCAFAQALPKRQDPWRKYTHGCASAPGAGGPAAASPGPFVAGAAALCWFLHASPKRHHPARKNGHAAITESRHDKALCTAERLPQNMHFLGRKSIVTSRAGKKMEMRAVSFDPS